MIMVMWCASCWEEVEVEDRSWESSSSESVYALEVIEFVCLKNVIETCSVLNRTFENYETCPGLTPRTVPMRPQLERHSGGAPTLKLKIRTCRYPELPYLRLALALNQRQWELMLFEQRQRKPN